MPNNLLAVTLTVCLVAAGSALGDADSEQIEYLIEQGQLGEALSLTNEKLTGDRDNVNYLFLKGLILTRQDKLDAAREIFISLTREHPELPEPFNNLAVIYAAQGDFTSARQALQQAINTHPSYATAHENMGDIYAKMASKAYNQALELDENNETAREKLLLVSDLFSAAAASQGAVAASNLEMEKITAEINSMERALEDAENQTREELNRSNQIRQDLVKLHTERTQIEQELKNATARTEVAKAELAGLEQQARQASEQLALTRQQAVEQTRKLETEIAAVTDELNQAIDRRDRIVKQAGTEQEQAEAQARTARAAVQQARVELAGLEQRSKNITEANLQERAAVDTQLVEARESLRQLQTEIAQLERNRTQIIAQTEQDKNQILAQIDGHRLELERLRQSHAELESQNRQVVAKLAETGNGTPAPAVNSDSVQQNETVLIEAVNAWAEKWSAQDVAGYLSSYAEDFKPGGGISRSVWASQRSERLMRPRYIRIGLDNFRVKFIGDQHAQVVFKQTYESDTYDDAVEKTLLLRLQGGRWLIAGETSD